jgi:hypothetical protein
MSSIASNSEDLILNADGGSSTVKFKIDGTEKASISSAGAFTSTTIDATKLTGNLPAISGANLTGVGVAGITSSADATAISIDSSERVGIGAATSPNTLFHVKAASGSVLRVEETSGSYIDIEAGGSTGHIKSKSGHDLTFSPGGNNHLQIMSSGRAKSQFTVGFWVRFNGGGTPSIADSHNVSSIGDWGTGEYGIYITSGFSNGNYCAQITCIHDRVGVVYTGNTNPQGGRLDIRTLVNGGSNSDTSMIFVQGTGDM